MIKLSWVFATRVYEYEACSEIIETFAFCPEHTDLDKQNSALLIIGLQ